jgi:hypothetical protein
MPKVASPDLLPAERRREVATILARGITRWRTRIQPILPVPPESPESPENGLEVPARKRLSVPQRTRGLWPRARGDNA